MLSILRIVAGLVFFVTGTMKLFGFPPFPTSTPTMAVTPPMWEFHLAGILETYLGGAFTLGFLTRWLSGSYVLRGISIRGGEWLPSFDGNGRACSRGVSTDDLGHGSASKTCCQRIRDSCAD